MTVVEKTEPHYECDKDGRTGRQRALDAMLRIAKELNVCPACAAAGAMYLAATAWVNSLGKSQESFMELAERIFRSTEAQRVESEAAKN